MTIELDDDASLHSARSKRIQQLAQDPRDLLQRLCFCIGHPYAHNVVTMSTETAEAILRMILLFNPSLALTAEALLERERLAHQELMRRRMARGPSLAGALADALEKG